MARHVNRLNALQVKRLVQPGMHADGNGLYLHVSETGAKSWRIIYKRTGKRRELGIGPLSAVSLLDAREKAAEARRILNQGQDPKDVWRASSKPKVAHTFGAVALDLIDGREPGWRSSKHAKQWQSTLETYAASIWDKPVAEVDVDDVLQILKPMWSDKAETAGRVRGRIEAVLDAAKVRRLRTGENPAAWRGNLSLLLPRRNKQTRGHHAAMPFQEVPSFMAALARQNGLAARALELTILTAARTSEVLLARWHEFDVTAATWTVPADRMKTGKEHRVPLSNAPRTLLRRIPREDDYLFPGSKPDRPLSNMAMTMVLRRMRLGHFTVHGFRSSFRDWCGETTSFPRELAEQALSHTVGSEVERAYRRGDALERRRELMEAWARFIYPVAAIEQVEAA